MVSDAPVRTTRVLDNEVGDPRLWDPSNEEFWSVCQAESEDDQQEKYRILTPGEDVRCPQARSNELVT